MVNLSNSEVMQLLQYRGIFTQMLTLANAYQLNTPEIWIAPIYHQVILCGNFPFFEEFLSCMPVRSEFFLDVVKRYRQEAHPASRAAAMRTFLEYVDDQALRAELTRELFGKQ